MDNDIFTVDENNNAAVRTVSVNSGVAETNSPIIFTQDENGNAAVRVINEGAGGDSHNKGYYATPEALEEALPTASAGDFAIVGSTDTVWIWDTDNEEWVDSDQKGQVISVNNKTGAVVLSGADLTTIVEISVSTLSQLLASDTIYNCGELSSLSVSFPVTPDVTYISQINFDSGATATTLSAPNTVKWLGDDVTANVFTPVANKRYAILFYFDGTNIRGLVQGI